MIPVSEKRLFAGFALAMLAPAFGAFWGARYHGSDMPLLFSALIVLTATVLLVMWSILKKRSSWFAQGGEAHAVDAPAALSDVERFFGLACDPLALSGFDGRMKRVNASFAHMLGWRSEEWITTSFLKFVYPADRPAMLDAMQQLESGKRVLHLETRMRHKDGSVRWVSWNATPLPEAGICYVSARDVTVERQSRELLVGVTEGLPGAVFQLVWPREGFPRFNFLSRGVEHLTGWAPVDLAGDPGKLFAQVLAEERAAFDDSLKRAATGKEWIHEFRISTTGGAERWVRGHAVVNRSGRHRVWNGYLYDISSRKVEEQTLANAKEAAEAANTAKSVFLATMSHEIRTPMNAVIGLVELLEGKVEEKEQREMLGVVRDSSEALLTIIDDVLDFSKIEAGRMELVRSTGQVASVVESVGKLFALRAGEKGVSLETVVDSDARLPMMIDAVRVRQILINLVSNAIKFTAEGGVTLSVSTVLQEPDKAEVRITVTDTGPGISVENQTRLFQPYAQARDMRAQGPAAGAATGTGLGLVISRRLAELMGGSLMMRSEQGKGTAMTLMLPLTRARAKITQDAAPVGPSLNASANKNQASASVTRIAKPNILVVDDNPVNRLVLSRQLQALGYSCRAASDGKEALAMLGVLRFDAILCDCQMPGMDGFELTREWRAREVKRTLPRTPVIACTASVSQADIAQCMQAGMDDYVTKPLTLERMREKLGDWLEGPAAKEAQSKEPGLPVTGHIKGSA